MAIEFHFENKRLGKNIRKYVATWDIKAELILTDKKELFLNNEKSIFFTDLVDVFEKENVILLPQKRKKIKEKILNFVNG